MSFVYRGGTKQNMKKKKKKKNMFARFSESEAILFYSYLLYIILFRGLTAQCY